VRPIYRTGTPLPSTHPIFYIFSTNTSTEFFLICCTPSISFSSKCRLFHNATFFGSCIIHILYTGCATRIKKIRCQKVNQRSVLRIHSICKWNICLMFCWPCKTNVINFLFNLLRIKDFYMFRALLAHPQEALHKRHLVYCVRVMSVGCIRIGVVQPTDITRTQYTKCRFL
jgi:hypothetical protein